MCNMYFSPLISFLVLALQSNCQYYYYVTYLHTYTAIYCTVFLSFIQRKTFTLVWHYLTWQIIITPYVCVHSPFYVKSEKKKRSFTHVQYSTYMYVHFDRSPQATRLQTRKKERKKKCLLRQFDNQL